MAYRLYNLTSAGDMVRIAAKIKSGIEVGTGKMPGVGKKFKHWIVGKWKF